MTLQIAGYIPKLFFEADIMVFIRFSDPPFLTFGPRGVLQPLPPLPFYHVWHREP